MMKVTATELKNKAGEQIQAAAHGPVIVTKSGKAVVALISMDLFERYRQLEDRYWGETAKKAKAGGFLTAKQSDALLDEMLSAED